jgi:hypothetical protein
VLCPIWAVHAPGSTAVNCRRRSHVRCPKLPLQIRYWREEICPCLVARQAHHLRAQLDPASCADQDTVSYVLWPRWSARSRVVLGLAHRRERMWKHIRAHCVLMTSNLGTRLDGSAPAPPVPRAPAAPSPWPPSSLSTTVSPDAHAPAGNDMPIVLPPAPSLSTWAGPKS